MGRKVFITSIPRSSEIGLDRITDQTSNRPVNKTKFGRAKTKLMALYSPQKGGLNNYISYTPYIDPETNLPAKDKQGNPIMLQQYLEKKYNKPDGYYSNMPPVKDQHPDTLTFFQTTYWVFQDGTTMLDLDNEMDELGYYMCLGSQLVANSEKEWREHKWPKALFYISLENESDEIKYQKNRIRSKAYAALEDSAFTQTYKLKVAVLLGLLSSKSIGTREQIENLLTDYIEMSSTTANSNIEKFMSLYGMLKTASGRETLEARYLLRQLLDNRIVYEKQDIYTWVRPQGNVILGERYSDAIDFLTSPKKDKEREELELELKKKLV